MTDLSLTVMKVQAAVFWVLTPCSDVVGYERFGGISASIFWVVTQCNVIGYQRLGTPCYLHLQGEGTGGGGGLKSGRVYRTGCIKVGRVPSVKI
jgi:hypothetical protein